MEMIMKISLHELITSFDHCMFGKKLNKMGPGETVYDFNVKQMSNRQRVCCIMNLSIFLDKKSS